MQGSKLREKRFPKKVNEVSLILLHVWSYMNDRSEQHKRTCHSKLGRGWSGGSSCQQSETRSLGGWHRGSSASSSLCWHKVGRGGFELKTLGQGCIPQAQSKPWLSFPLQQATEPHADSRFEVDQQGGVGASGEHMRERTCREVRKKVVNNCPGTLRSLVGQRDQGKGLV